MTEDEMVGWHHQLDGCEFEQSPESLVSCKGSQGAGHKNKQNSWSSLKFMSIELVMPSNHFILCHPLLLLHSIFPRIPLHQVAKVLEIQLQHQPFQ